VEAAVPGRRQELRGSRRCALDVPALPPAQGRALRTTTALERISEEFRRRTKTQASLPSQDAVLLLLYGLLRSGQIRLRAIDGWQEMKAVKEAA
jgi:transposase-like protein